MTNRDVNVTMCDLNRYPWKRGIKYKCIVIILVPSVVFIPIIIDYYHHIL